MNQHLEAAIESSRMAGPRPLYIVTARCGLPIHGHATDTTAGASEWDYIHRATLAAHFGDEGACRFVPTQWWTWPAHGGQPDGDAVVTHTHVSIRSGLTTRVLRVSGLATAMHEVGLDISVFEVCDVPAAGRVAA